MASRRRFILSAALTPLTGALAAARPGQPDFTPGKGIRGQFLVPSNKLYFNTGSLGPSPLPVIRSVEEAMRQLERDPVSENWGALGERMEQVRGQVASFINGRPADVLLTRNTTEGLSLVAQSLRLQPGDEILTTTLEHGGAEVGLDHLAATQGVVIKRADVPVDVSNPEEVVRGIVSQVSSRTRAMWLSHVNTVTGLIMPFGLMAEACRKNGILLIADGAQAVGNIPVDVEALGVDAYACSGHKWLFGPKETGFLWTRPGFGWTQRPVFVMDGYGTYSRASGTRNVAVLSGLGTAVDWHLQARPDIIRDHAMGLRDRLRERLEDDARLRIISPSGRMASCILSFSLQNTKNNDVFQKLKQDGIIVKLLPQMNALRISLNVFHTDKDIDVLTDAISRCM